MRRTPAPIQYIPTIVLFLFIGWGGLVVLMNYTLPTLWPRWLFFFLLVIAFTGLALPLMAWLNHRFPGNFPAAANTVVRQALWVGVYFAMLAWLQYGRVLSFSLALIFFLGFGAIEVFIRLWERSQWRQPE